MSAYVIINDQVFNTAVNADRLAVLSQIYPCLTLELLTTVDKCAMALDEQEYLKQQHADTERTDR